MRQYKLNAIVLGSRKIGDADKIYHLFSKEKGKINLKARGVRKSSSKLRSHLDTLNLTTIEAVKGKGSLDVITAANSTEMFSGIKNNIEKISLGYFLAEQIDRLVPEEQKNEEIFKLLADTLEALGQNHNELLHIKLAFSCKLLKLLGHDPHIKGCISCNKGVAENEKNFFNTESGGIICPTCDVEGSKFEVSLECLKILNAFGKIEISKIKNLKIKNESIKEALSLIKTFNHYIFEKELKSEEFLKIFL